MLTLSRGPTEQIRALVGPDMMGIFVLRTIHQLKIAEAVPHTPEGISIDDLADKLDVKATWLRQMLRFAFTLRIFCEGQGKPDHVAHSAISATIPTLGPFLWVQLGTTLKVPNCGLEFPRALKSWPKFPLALVDPKGDERDFWTLLEEEGPDGKGPQHFDAAMRNDIRSYHGDDPRHFVDGFDWAALGEDATVVDVGGGSGHQMIPVAKAFPNLRVVIQDVAKNEEPAEKLIRESGITNMVFQEQDFFQPQPESLKPNAYLLSRILHDWKDEEAIDILSRLLPAVKNHGTRIFVAERVLADKSDGTEMPLYHEAQLRSRDLLMWAFFGSGERTKGQWADLFKRADEGLKIQGLTPNFLGSELSMMTVGL